MSYVLPELSEDKPSKLLNLTYVFFGLFISYFVSSITPSFFPLNFEEKISSIVLFGGAIGTFVYYLSPVERIVDSYLRIRKLNIKEFEFAPPEKPFKYDKTELLHSPLLKEDLARITGALFFFVSILLSLVLVIITQVDQVAKAVLIVILIISLAVMGTVGVLDTKDLIRTKLDCVMYYYFYAKFDRSYAMELLNAIRERDWFGAENTINRNIERGGSVYATRGGFCFKCGRKQSEGLVCAHCGAKLKFICSNCKAPIVREVADENIRYCVRCGKKLGV